MLELNDSDGGATAELCALIAEALDVGEVAVDDDFFELGGTSLRGVMLIGLIQRRLGTQLTLGDLYAEPTASGLAKRIRHDPSAPPAELAPVFLIHWLAKDLAREIARRRPIVVLSHGLGSDGGDRWPPPAGIEVLAERYVAELRRLRPEGPYHLVGHSRAGIIAWEMARQLTEAGAEMGLLCVIDALPPEVRHLPVSRSTVVRNVVAASPRTLARKSRRRIVDLASRPAWVRRLRWQRSDQTGRLEMIDTRLRDYRMRPFDGRLLLVESTEPSPSLLYKTPPPAAKAYEQLGLVPHGYRLLQLPGGHTALVTAPLAADVAAAIDRAIQD